MLNVCWLAGCGSVRGPQCQNCESTEQVAPAGNQLLYQYSPHGPRNYGAVETLIGMESRPILPGDPKFAGTMVAPQPYGAGTVAPNVYAPPPTRYQGMITTSPSIPPAPSIINPAPPIIMPLLPTVQEKPKPNNTQWTSVPPAPSPRNTSLTAKEAERKAVVSEEKSPPIIVKEVVLNVGKVPQGDIVKDVTGEVEKFQNTWRLRYASIDVEDEYGGSFVLDGAIDASRLREGQRIRVHGQVIPPENRQTPARCVVQTVDILN
jgi:hypothetical protein